MGDGNPESTKPNRQLIRTIHCGGALADEGTMLDTFVTLVSVPQLVESAGGVHET